MITHANHRLYNLVAQNFRGVCNEAVLSMWNQNEVFLCYPNWGYTVSYWCFQM